MRLFPSFGPARRRPPPPVQLETKGDVERRATSGGVYLAGGGVPYRGTWSIERAVSDGLERVVWVYRCVDAIASDESRLPIVWRSGHPEDGDEIKPSAEPLWKLLNRRANPYESAQAFRYRLSTQLLLCKQGVFVEVVRNREKEVSALYLLPPHRTAPIPDPDKFVAGYEVYGSTGEIYRLRPEQVLWIRRPHPLDPYMGMTPMEAAGLAVDVDFYARIYNRNFMMNDGRPGGVLNVKGYLSQEDADELENRFNGGTSRAGKVTILESDGVEYVDTSTSARDMQYAETRTAMMKEILMAFGVPETRAGDSSQRCVDDQTEALTTRGWLRGDEITTSDTILSMDCKTGRLVWSPVREVYRAHYSGPMYRLKHRHADFLVTPGHNWVVEERAGQGRGPRGEKRLEWKQNLGLVLKKVEDLSSHDRIRTIGDAEDSNEEAVYSSAFVELVGWAVTEGCYDRPSYVRLTQKEGERAERIRVLLKEAGALWSEGFQRDRPHIRRFYVRGEVATAITAVSPDRVISREFILQLTAAQRELLMQTLVDADGGRPPGTTSLLFLQKDREAVESFVFLAALAGYTASIRPKLHDYKGETLTYWLAIVHRRKVMTIQRSTRTVEHYDGEVWCPRTDYGTFVARRHGRMLLTGNTFDNADAEIEMYWRDTMRAHCDIIDAAFDSLTAGGIDDDIFTAHDTSSIYVLNRDQKDREGRFLNLWNAGLITVDEYREGVGREPLKRPGSKVVWVQAQGKLPVGDEDDEATMQAIASGQPAPGAEAPVEEAPAGLGPPEEEPDIDWDTWGMEAGGEEAGGEGGGGGGGGLGRGPSGYSRFEAAEGPSGPEWNLEDAVIGKALFAANGNGNGSGDGDNTPVNTGIMISIDLPDRTARALLDTLLADHDGPAEAADDLHITLVYLGKTSDVLRSKSWSHEPASTAEPSMTAVRTSGHGGARNVGPLGMPHEGSGSTSSYEPILSDAKSLGGQPGRQPRDTAGPNMVGGSVPTTDSNPRSASPSTSGKQSWNDSAADAESAARRSPVWDEGSTTTTPVAQERKAAASVYGASSAHPATLDSAGSATIRSSSNKQLRTSGDTGAWDSTGSFSAEDVLAAVSRFADLAPPIVVAISGIGHFSIPEGTATYASVDSPDLPDFRQRLVSLLRLADIHSPSEHGFSPHITLAYTPPGQAPPDIPIEQLSTRMAQLTFTVPEVAVHWGDEVHRFPLRGRARTLVDLGTA